MKKEENTEEDRKKSTSGTSISRLLHPLRTWNLHQSVSGVLQYDIEFYLKGVEKKNNETILSIKVKKDSPDLYGIKKGQLRTLADDINAKI